MNVEVLLLLFGALLISTLVVFNLLIWIRPEVIVKIKGPSLRHSGLATLLAVVLFLSCFLLGVWISVLKLQGKLGIFL